MRASIGFGTPLIGRPLTSNAALPLESIGLFEFFTMYLFSLITSASTSQLKSYSGLTHFPSIS